MANLGNAWHIPDSPEPRGRAGMRDPVNTIVPGATVTIFSGNQFQGADGNPGNQLQNGSALFFKRTTDAGWSFLPLIFNRTIGNNKYYAAIIPSGTFQAGDAVQYYLRIAYDDHDTTFLHTQGNTSVTTADEAAAQARPFTFFVESSAVKGEWAPVFDLPNVAIHTSVLPNSSILMWGRRDKPTDSLDVNQCTPFIWNPATGVITNTPQPKLANGTKVNLFCAGHAFLPDGRLLAVGGHLSDSDGVNQAVLYDTATNKWTPTARMNRGRWYPTATILADGGVLVLAGSYKEKGVIVHNTLPQVWKNGAWAPIAEFPDNDGTLELYPRMHVASDGRVFMSGPLEMTYRLDTSNGGKWIKVAPRALRQRDYCPSVMYDVDKIIYIGGGGGGNIPPTAEAEIIDLGQNPPTWRKASPMHFRRRQHNATILADGTVLVTGGTRGVGGPSNGFNDLTPGQPVHIAELWDPVTNEWTELGAEQVDRCYHATAVLLPDARVLSAGGGEYRPLNGVDAPNDPEESHRNGQIFSPPYLFKGARPVITGGPASVQYGETFQVGTSEPHRIGKVTWIRLPSVTHSYDQNQRINFLQFSAGAGVLNVAAPNSPKLCPPGHYMLFILSKEGVPSVAKILQIQAVVPGQPLLGLKAVPAEEAEPSLGGPLVSAPVEPVPILARRATVLKSAKGTPVVVGITGTCPYGIAACWGGANEALHRLDGVSLVDPVPNADDSTAEVFLADEGLPALDRWDEQFQSIVNGRYQLRGIEVTLQGLARVEDERLFLTGTAQRPPVQLAPLASTQKVQWSLAARAPKPLEASESGAYERLATVCKASADGLRVVVTGPLEQIDGGYRLHVRAFEL